jgi:hypothetical protein
MKFLKLCDFCELKKILTFFFFVKNVSLVCILVNSFRRMSQLLLFFLFKISLVVRLINPSVLMNVSSFS